MGRKSSRKHAFSIVYQFQFHAPLDAGELMGTYLECTPELSNEDSEYVSVLVNGTAAHIDEIDALIAGHAVGWTFERIATVDLAIMRLALFEMQYREDVPVGVAINEAVELAKAYGTDESAAFINGLLAQAAKHCERGLL